MPIPKLFHQIWIGSDLPDEFAHYMEGWKQNHPDWEHVLWTDLDVSTLKLKNRDLYNHAEEIAPRNVGQFRADLLRYELLFQFGGVYVDADFESLRPIDSLCNVN